MRNSKKKDLIINHVELTRLQDELEYLKTIRRPEAVKDLAETRVFGDLSENAEYDLTRNLLCDVEQRIQEIEDIFSRVIDVD